MKKFILVQLAVPREILEACNGTSSGDKEIECWRRRDNPEVTRACFSHSFSENKDLCLDAALEPDITPVCHNMATSVQNEADCFTAHRQVSL